MVEGIYRLFDSIWRLSLVGSYCILLVILARFLLKKAPKWCSYLLWGIVFVRLCCPVLPGTRISLIPECLLTVGTATTSAQLAAGNSAGSVDNEGVYNGSLIGDNTVDAVLSGADNTENLNGGTLGAAGNGEGSAPVPGQDGNVEGMNEIGDDGVGGIQAPGNVTNALDDGYPVDNRDNADDSLQRIGATMGKTWFRVLLIAWLLGMAGFMGYHTFSYLRMRHRIRRPDSGVRQVEPGICEIDGGHLSFVMGLIHPVIYLSSGLDPESRKVVLCHERVHLQRRDYLFKPAALLICCVHWFNPLVWLAFYLMNMDCEMSCDEKVVKLLGEESKKIYSYTLLEEASGGEWKRYRGGSICALLSFGEDHVKNRIRHVLDYRKPPFWVMIGAAAVIVVLVVCLCSNPGGNGNGADTANVSDVSDATEEVTTGEFTEDGSDDEGRKTEWLAALEQGIHSREEFSALFDVDTLEDTRSFAGQDGIQYLEYNGVAARKLHRQILDGDTAAHETYKDPVKAAEALLHLEGGSGEMTELLYEAERQYLFFQKDSTRPGEGLWQTYIIFSLTDPILIFPWYSPRRAVRSGCCHWEISTVKDGILTVRWMERIRQESSMRNMDRRMWKRILWREPIPGIIRRYLRDLLEINMLLIRCPVTASMWQPGVMPDWIVSYRGILRRDMQHPTGHAYIRIGDSSILRISVTI
jgi:beta-lactamase regulating signal transducer with metallopeptidase domain